MNGWLNEDGDDPREHEASDKEIDSDLESTIVTQVTNNVNNSNGGNGGNGRNGGNNGCTYKGFTACNPKETLKGEVRCASSFVNKAIGLVEYSSLSMSRRSWIKGKGGDNRADHAGYTDRFHELAKSVPHLVTPKSSRIKMYIAGHCDLTLTKRNEKRKGVEESSNARVKGRAFNVNAVDALQDPNVVMGTFSLNHHYATVLFDYGADFSFISSDFAPLINVKSSFVNPGYVIEVADGKKRSFDVIVGMDWLSEHKAEIVCHEKVVRIPLESGDILRVQGERTLGIAKALSNVKVDEPKLSDISIVRDFVEVFLEDLSGLPPQRQVESQDLDSGATPVRIYSKTKDEHEVYLRLVLELLKREELYAKFSKCEFWLQEVQFLGHVLSQNGIHVDPSKIKAVKNWKSPTTPSKIPSFLGLARYYRRFIANFSKIAKPLTTLT
ncbi:putative reverse transcriptase domain-containing protein [Tanacetum coccineum]|uniref:Reverse transcriptase domain-containing protein n=1 Tax=Tanacetum coccineum TaxID=301880 RepID=A0ABQ5J0C5_9ASTR